MTGQGTVRKMNRTKRKLETHRNRSDSIQQIPFPCKIACPFRDRDRTNHAVMLSTLGIRQKILHESQDDWAAQYQQGQNDVGYHSQGRTRKEK